MPWKRALLLSAIGTSGVFGSCAAIILGSHAIVKLISQIGPIPVFGAVFALAFVGIALALRYFPSSTN